MRNHPAFLNCRLDGAGILQIVKILVETIDSSLQDAREEFAERSDKSHNPNNIEPDDWQLARQIAVISDREVRQCLEGLV